MFSTITSPSQGQGPRIFAFKKRKEKKKKLKEKIIFFALLCTWEQYYPCLQGMVDCVSFSSISTARFQAVFQTYAAAVCCILLSNRFESSMQTHSYLIYLTKRSTSHPETATLCNNALSQPGLIHSRPSLANTRACVCTILSKSISSYLASAAA